MFGSHESELSIRPYQLFMAEKSIKINASYISYYRYTYAVLRYSIW